MYKIYTYTHRHVIISTQFLGLFVFSVNSDLEICYLVVWGAFFKKCFFARHMQTEITEASFYKEELLWT